MAKRWFIVIHPTSERIVGVYTELQESAAARHAMHSGYFYLDVTLLLRPLCGDVSPWPIRAEKRPDAIRRQVLTAIKALEPDAAYWWTLTLAHHAHQTATVHPADEVTESAS